MKNNNAMKLEFNDALLVTLFGTPDRDDTIERLRIVCTAFADEDLRMKAVILKEQISKISNFVWPELYRQTRWNMDSILDLDRFGWDEQDDFEEDDDLDDEDNEV